MIEVKNNLWEYPCYWICIPVSGVVNEAGEAELPTEVIQKCWDAPFLLGEKIKKNGNVFQEIRKITRDNYVPKAPENCYQLTQVVVTLFSFPINDLQLIETSCQELASRYNGAINANKFQWPRKYEPIICIPRVGDWARVKPIFEKYFVSNDFIVCKEV